MNAEHEPRDDLGLLEGSVDPTPSSNQPDPWQVLVVDDDPEVLQLTRLFLSNLSFESRPIRSLMAASAAEARAHLAANADIAVVLLDVVMETDHAGLDLARAIREDLDNQLIRIVLRTGEPGQAPPVQVVRDYEIDAYCAKTEMTHDRLFTVIVAALRGFRVMQAMDRQHRELEESIAQRDRLESELRRSQKLEAVGRLAAGIAHEINTPIQYVRDSCQFVGEGAEELRSLARVLEQSVVRLATGDGEPAEILAAARRACEHADLDYLDEQLPRGIERLNEGLNRISTIVRSMKEFAHPATSECRPEDLNRAVRNTLAVARNEYKDVATVETDLGPLPPVWCRLGEVNQALLNIIVNAAQAITERQQAEAGAPAPGVIRVRTWREGDEACIRIADNGCGVPAGLASRIFDPFFTTKEVGRGTGQGLSITYNIIVERHHGAIHLDSAPGEGAAFTLSLPLRQAPPAGRADDTAATGQDREPPQ